MCVSVCSVDLSLLNFVYDFCLGGVGFRDYPCGGPFFVVIILAGVTTLVGVHSLNQSLGDVENFRKLEGVHFFSQSCRQICESRVQHQVCHFAFCIHIHAGRTNLKNLLIYNLRCDYSCGLED